MGGAHIGGAHMGGIHHGAHPGYGGAHHSHYAAPYHSGSRLFLGGGYGYGYGSGLYGPLGYGLGYSPFGYSSLNYGGLGYGALGYGYGYPNSYSGSYGSLGTPVIPNTYTAPYQYTPQYTPSQPMMVNPDPQPQPLPVPAQPGSTGEGQPGTITVITNEGATVTFDGIDTKETGARHSFTTKPIPPGAEKRVQIKVDGPGGPSTISVGVRSGEKATVDLRK
jgi:uncharacterized protein (TIGR03000 family)